MRALDEADRLAENHPIPEQERLARLVHGVHSGHEPEVVELALRHYASGEQGLEDVGKSFDFEWARPESAKAMETEIAQLDRKLGRWHRRVRQNFRPDQNLNEVASETTFVKFRPLMLAMSAIAAIGAAAQMVFPALHSDIYLKFLFGLFYLATVSMGAAYGWTALLSERRLRLMPLTLNRTLVSQWLTCPRAQRYLQAVMASHGNLDLRMGDRAPLQAMVKAHEAQRTAQEREHEQRELHHQLQSRLA